MLAKSIKYSLIDLFSPVAILTPETLFNTLKESGVLDDDYKYKVFCTFLKVRNFDDFEEKVNSRSDR